MAPLDDKTHEEIVTRVLAAREQRPQMLAQMKERQQQGLEVARRCAQVLKQDFEVGNSKFPKPKKYCIGTT